MVICHRTKTPVSSPTEIPFSFTLDLTRAQCVPELLQGCGEVGSEGGGEGKRVRHLMGKVGRGRGEGESVKVDGKTVPFTCTLVHSG